MKIDYSRSIVEIVLDHAITSPGRPALVFDPANGDAKSLCYRELGERINRTAGALASRGLTGRHVALLFAPGIDFVVALLATLAAGSVAIPVAPTGRRRARLQNILEFLANVSPQAIIIDAAMARLFGPELSSSAMAAGTTYLEFDDLAEQGTPAEERFYGRDALAILQFTSGTTSRPKGVMITHGNIIANETMIKEAFGHDRESHFVGWVPHYHDQGLFGNILQPLFLGSTCILTSPAVFISKPMTWLELISRHRAHTSGGPNFGFDLCVDFANRRGVPELDLSSWRVAFNGAERVRPSTHDNFASCFANRGFDKRAFLPCYGLAECTLVTVAAPKLIEPIAKVVDGRELSAGHATAASSNGGSVELACCGPAMVGTDAIVVDPATRTRLPHGEVGEIWVSGAHISPGYFNDLEATAETFGAYMHTGAGPFLRTGDLAFTDQDGFYIVGRLKDLLVIRGRNFAPSDIEQLWAELNPNLARGNTAAVQIDCNGVQHVVLIAEVKREDVRSLSEEGAQHAAGRLRQAVMEKFELGLTDLVIVNEGSLPRTTSGKVQRKRAAQMLTEQEFSPLVVAGPLASAFQPQAHRDMIQRFLRGGVENG